MICVNCKYCIGYDKEEKCYMCAIDHTYIEAEIAEDDNYECDLFVSYLDDDN